MNKTQRNSILQIIYMLIFFSCIAFVILTKQNFYFLIAAIIIPSIITWIISLFIPVKQNKKNSKKKNQEIEKRKNKRINGNTSVNVNHNFLHSDEEIYLLPLEKLTWRDFERLCYLYFKAKGYKPRKTSEGADGGVDLIVYNKHHKTDVAIQIKKYAKGNQITVREIRELATAKKNHNCMLADFITTSSFTNAALREADKFNILCRDKEWVQNKILKWRNTQQ